MISLLFSYLVSPYRVGLDVLITLEFRTSRTNGVLLTISNQVSDGLGLEIVEGKVLYFGEYICLLPGRDLLGKQLSNLMTNTSRAFKHSLRFICRN